MRRTLIAVLLVMTTASFCYGTPCHRHRRHSPITGSPGNPSKDDLDVIEAAHEGNVVWLRSLFARGARANANFGDMGMGSPLMAAAAMGHPAAVRLLLSHGAYVNSQNNIGDTALDHAEGAERLTSDPVARGKYRQVIAILKGAGGVKGEDKITR